MCARVYHSTGVEVRTNFRSGFLPCTYVSWGWNLAASTLTHWAILLVLVSIFSKRFCVVCLASVREVGRCNSRNSIPDRSLRRFLFHSRMQDTRDPWKNTVLRESVSGKGWRWKQGKGSKEKTRNSRNNLKYAENRAKVPFDATLRKKHYHFCVPFQNCMDRNVLPLAISKQPWFFYFMYPISLSYQGNL